MRNKNTNTDPAAFEFHWPISGLQGIRRYPQESALSISQSDHDSASIKLRAKYQTIPGEA